MINLSKKISFMVIKDEKIIDLCIIYKHIKIKYSKHNYQLTHHL